MLIIDRYIIATSLSAAANYDEDGNCNGGSHNDD
jgi:hypothetical protein